MNDVPITRDHQPPIEQRLYYWQMAALELIKNAELDGVIITVERMPLQPLAMRNHIAHIQVREKR